MLHCLRCSHRRVRAVPDAPLKPPMPTATAATAAPPALHILGPIEPGFSDILTPAALRFLTVLARSFEPRRQELLAHRTERQRRLSGGELPDFLPETRAVRQGAWTVAPTPPDLLDRRVEITGPVDRKMVINAL